MIDIAPANPSTNDSVVISVRWSGCVLDSGIQQVGTVFNIHYNYSSVCFATAPTGVGTFDVGKLPAGNYTINYTQLMENAPRSQESASFQVNTVGEQAFGAPTLDLIGIGTLIVALALAATRTILRRK